MSDGRAMEIIHWADMASTFEFVFTFLIECVEIQKYFFYYITSIFVGIMSSMLTPEHCHAMKLFFIIYYISRSRLLVVMELMEGGELFDRISKYKYFTEFQAANYTRQV